jgi:hypothetical protein
MNIKTARLAATLLYAVVLSAPPAQAIIDSAKATRIVQDYTRDVWKQTRDWPDAAFTLVSADGKSRPVNAQEALTVLQRGDTLKVSKGVWVLSGTLMIPTGARVQGEGLTLITGDDPRTKRSVDYFSYVTIEVTGDKTQAVMADLILPSPVLQSASGSGLILEDVLVIGGMFKPAEKMVGGVISMLGAVLGQKDAAGYNSYTVSPSGYGTYVEELRFKGPERRVERETLLSYAPPVADLVKALVKLRSDGKMSLPPEDLARAAYQWINNDSEKMLKAKSVELFGPPSNMFAERDYLQAENAFARINDWITRHYPQMESAPMSPSAASAASPRMDQAEADAAAGRPALALFQLYASKTGLTGDAKARHRQIFEKAMNALGIYACDFREDASHAFGRVDPGHNYQGHVSKAEALQYVRQRIDETYPLLFLAQPRNGIVLNLKLNTLETFSDRSAQDLSSVEQLKVVDAAPESSSKRFLDSWSKAVNYAGNALQASGEASANAWKNQYQYRVRVEEVGGDKYIVSYKGDTSGRASAATLNALDTSRREMISSTEKSVREGQKVLRMVTVTRKYWTYYRFAAQVSGSMSWGGRSLQLNPGYKERVWKTYCVESREEDRTDPNIPFLGGAEGGWQGRCEGEQGLKYSDYYAQNIAPVIADALAATVAADVVRRAQDAQRKKDDRGYAEAVLLSVLMGVEVNDPTTISKLETAVGQKNPQQDVKKIINWAKLYK